MSHEIYTTKGFIISSENRNESDKTFFIFTEKLGLIRAQAGGVRKLESKLRFVLQDFSYTEISLVSGRFGWKIVGASALNFFSEKIEKSRTKVQALRLLKKLCPQDEPLPVLFSEIKNAFVFMDNQKLFSDKSMDALLVLKVLSHLGYWGDENENSFVESPFNNEILNEITKVRKHIITQLNNSLRATQLL